MACNNYLRQKRESRSSSLCQCSCLSTSDNLSIMQLVGSLVSVLLLVWSVRATTLPGEERLQSTRVSTACPGQEQDRGKERDTRASRLCPMQLFHPFIFQGIAV